MPRTIVRKCWPASALRLAAWKNSTTGVVMSADVPADDILLGSFSRTEPRAKVLTRRAKMEMT
jgi:hypothetical protein